MTQKVWLPIYHVQQYEKNLSLAFTYLMQSKIYMANFCQSVQRLPCWQIDIAKRALQHLCALAAYDASEPERKDIQLPKMSQTPTKGGQDTINDLQTHQQTYMKLVQTANSCIAKLVQQIKTLNTATSPLTKNSDDARPEHRALNILQSFVDLDNTSPHALMQQKVLIGLHANTVPYSKAFCPKLRSAIWCLRAASTHMNKAENILVALKRMLTRVQQAPTASVISNNTQVSLTTFLNKHDSLVYAQDIINNLSVTSHRENI